MSPPIREGKDATPVYTKAEISQWEQDLKDEGWSPKVTGTVYNKPEPGLITKYYSVVRYLRDADGNKIPTASGKSSRTEAKPGAAGKKIIKMEVQNEKE